MAESRLTIYGAIAANLAIAATKFVVAGVTGSSAMMSEGIHSAVDTGNGVLLLIGTHLSERPPSEQHPFGHGKELFFWSLIVAVLIFGIGGGVSFYEGIQHMRNPEPLKDPMWNYIVLAAAAVFEGISFGIALKAFLAERLPGPFWNSLFASKDPTTYTVLAEDAAALLGLAVAAAGVYASHRLDMPALDGAASVVIGLLLAGVAVVLVHEARGLLIGEGIRPATARDVRAIVSRQPHVRGVGWPLSMYVGAKDVLLVLDVEFEPDASGDEIASTVQTIEDTIRARYPVIRRIYLDAGRPAGSANAPAASGA